MFYAYILKSLSDGIFYYGSASNIESRLKEHNYGHVRTTKGHRPYKIHYFEIFNNKTDAIKRELSLRVLADITD